MLSLNNDCVSLIIDELKERLFFLHTCRFLTCFRKNKENYLRLWKGPCKSYLGELIKKYYRQDNTYGIKSAVQYVDYEAFRVWYILDKDTNVSWVHNYKQLLASD